MLFVLNSFFDTWQLDCIVGAKLGPGVFNTSGSVEGCGAFPGGCGGECGGEGSHEPATPAVTPDAKVRADAEEEQWQPPLSQIEA